MSSSPDRREFLSASAIGAAGLPLLAGLQPVRAADAKLDPNLVRLDSGIEPLVRLLEETPRNEVVEEVAARVKKGLGYQEVLAALLLAGVRNVQPRPNVGFKFHAVLVVNSAHLASLAGPDNERWLPIFWAIDNFKSSQAQTLKESGWRMRPVDEMKLPPARKAKAAFTAAMDDWDEEAADAAVAALARTAGANELFELFARYGCRDFRSIGHKAIFVANSFRTLQCIGWHHAEPVLRSLAYALLNHEGENPAKRDGDPDRPGRKNAELVKRIRKDWVGGKDDAEATTELLATLRDGSERDAAEKAAEQLNAGVSPRSVWDGLFLGAGECLMQQPGIVGLHTLTTMNALRYAYDASGDDETRRVLTLQGASFLPLFREAMTGRGKVGDARIDKLEPAGKPDGAGAVYAELSRDKASAARMALGYLTSDGQAGKKLIDAGRLLVFLKGDDSHDYKFSSAVLEDYANVTPHWRDRFLAASLYWLKGSGGRDAPIVKRVHAALA
jgi:hypothetical protein